MYKNVKSYKENKDLLTFGDIPLFGDIPPVDPDEKKFFLIAVGCFIGISFAFLLKLAWPESDSETIRNQILDKVEKFYNDLKETDFTYDYQQQILTIANQVKNDIRILVQQHNNDVDDKYRYKSEEIQYFESLVDQNTQLVLDILKTVQDYQEKKISQDDSSEFLIQQTTDQDDLNELKKMVLDWLDNNLDLQNRNSWQNQPEKFQKTDNFDSVNDLHNQTTENAKKNTVSQQATVLDERDPGLEIWEQFFGGLSEKFVNMKINYYQAISDKYIENIPDKIVFSDELFKITQNVNLTNLFNQNTRLLDKNSEEKIRIATILINNQLQAVNSKLEVSFDEVRRIIIQESLIKQIDADYKKVLLAMRTVYQKYFYGQKVRVEDRDYFLQTAEKIFSILKSEYAIYAKKYNLVNIKNRRDIEDVHQYWLEEMKIWFPPIAL